MRGKLPTDFACSVLRDGVYSAAIKLTQHGGHQCRYISPCFDLRAFLPRRRTSVDTRNHVLCRVQLKSRLLYMLLVLQGSSPYKKISQRFMHLCRTMVQDNYDAVQVCRYENIKLLLILTISLKQGQMDSSSNLYFKLPEKRKKTL